MPQHGNPAWSTKAVGRVCLLTQRAWHRLCTVGASTGHLPTSWTHAPVTNPRLGQTRERCMRRLLLGEVAGVRGANVGSREMTATAAVGPQCWAMQDVSIIGSRLVHKAAGAISHRSSWLTAKTSSFSCYVFDAHGDGSSGAAASILYKRCWPVFNYFLKIRITNYKKWCKYYGTCLRTIAYHK